MPIAYFIPEANEKFVFVLGRFSDLLYNRSSPSHNVDMIAVAKIENDV